MRAFLAIEIPDRIKKELVGIQRELKSQLTGVRWERAEKLHLTLVFLGEISEGGIKDLEGAAQKGVESAKPFEVELSGVRVFPNGKRPRAVLVEVGEGSEEFRRLQKGLEEELSAAGFNFRPGRKPHVTVGRFRRGIDATRRVSVDSTLRPSTSSGRPRAESRGWVGDFQVKEVAIVKSELRPTGAIHTPIARISLGDREERGELGA